LIVMSRPTAFLDDATQPTVNLGVYP
jgi:hypothetical protein